MARLAAALWNTGLRLRCPVCREGPLFKGGLTMHATCPRCGARFERHQGEGTGGMTVSIVVTALIFLVGYYLAERLTTWPVAVHLAMWVPFALLFPILFYRTARAVWVALLHASGDVHPDSAPYQPPEPSIVDAFLYRPPSAAPPPTDPDDPPPSRS